MHDSQETMFYGYFGMLSDFCWRRSNQELQPIPAGVCFCDINQKAIAQGGERSPDIIAEVVQKLQLQHIKPPQNR